MSLHSGTRVGPYEILSAIGAGGMGEVYRARDTRLQRDVALKVLPDSVADDPDRLMRFEREAHALAALNHPNIAQVYGLEDGALIMELVEGEDLSDRIARGAVPLEEALPIARQVADGLEAAHEAGVIHRDLKPANIKVKPDGTVKLLDFGLAKALEGDTRAGSASAVQTQTSPAMTAMGVILGTAGYMSPEQAKGSAVDRRADVWALGVVLYEMLTGSRLFDAPTVAETVAQVLTRLVDVSKLPPEIPRRLRWLVARLLERNPNNRLHDMADVRIVLDEIIAGEDDAPPAATGPASGFPSTWAVAAGAAVVGFAAATLYFGFIAEPGNEIPAALRAPVEFQVAAPEGTSLVPGLALSPDGRMVAFVARGASGRTALWVRSLEAVSAREVAGTEDARYPFWAPDGKRIGFFAQGFLKTTGLLGGQPLSIAEVGSTQDTRGGAWGADDVIVFAPFFAGPLLSVSADGGPTTEATKLADSSTGGTHRFPTFLPDGRRFLFYASEGTGVEPATIRLGRIGSVESKSIGRSNSFASFVAPDLVLYTQGMALVAQSWDDDQEELVGDPMPLGVELPGGISVSGQRSLGVSPSGVLAYRVDKRYASRLVWVDRSGNELGEISQSRETWHYTPRVSADGRYVAVSQYEPGSQNGSVWLHDLTRGISTRLTGDDGDDSALALSPDGQTVAYASVGGALSGIFLVEPARPGRPQLWMEGTSLFPASWSPNGQSIYYQRFEPSGRPSLWVRPLGGGEATRLDNGFAAEFSPELSPDGRWMAYVSDATRRFEIYVRTADDPKATPVRVSPDGGLQPQWGPNGRELFYVDETGRLVAVPFSSFDPLTPGAPVPLFQAHLEESLDRQWDVSPDGKRFLLNRTLIGDTAPITVVVGWRQRIAELTAR